MTTLPIQFQDYQERTVGLINEIDDEVRRYVKDTNSSGDITKVLERVRTIIGDRQKNIQPLSNDLPLRSPVLYDIYQPAVATLEGRVTSAIYTYALEVARLATGLYALQHVEEQPAVKSVTDSLLLPWPHDLQEWGRQEHRGTIASSKGDGDKKEPTIKLDEKRAVADLRTAIVAAMHQKMQLPVPKGLPPSPEDVINERKGAKQAAYADAMQLLEVKFPNALQVMLDESAKEDITILPGYADQLSTLMSDLPPIYHRLVETSATQDDLKKQYVELMNVRLGYIGQLFESYRQAAPIIPPQQDIPAVPTTRNTSLLYQTPEGRQFVALYDASRRVLPADIVREHKFLDDIPRNAMAGEMSTGAAPWALTNPHPMDRVTLYFWELDASDELQKEIVALKKRDVQAPPRGRR